MHCHTEFHAMDGMSLYLKVGENEDMPEPPAAMKRCGDFQWSEEEFDKLFEDKEKGRSRMKANVMAKASSVKSTGGMDSSVHVEGMLQLRVIYK